MASALMRWVHADERQVPMGLLGVVFRHLLEDRAARLPASGEAVLSISSPKRSSSGCTPGRSHSAAPAYSSEQKAPPREGGAPKRADEPRHGRQVLVRLRPHPSRHWIPDEREDHRIDCPTFIVRSHGSDLHAVLPCCARIAPAPGRTILDRQQNELHPATVVLCFRLGEHSPIVARGAPRREGAM